MTVGENFFLFLEATTFFLPAFLPPFLSLQPFPSVTLLREALPETPAGPLVRRGGGGGEISPFAQALVVCEPCEGWNLRPHWGLAQGPLGREICRSRM